ncbi:aspartate/glutamate racemase family protein [Chloroflexota bacterium]
MKTIGLIGGMSAESSIEYYRIINETIREKLGGLHSAKSVMVSVDFAEIEVLQSAGKWDQATEIMIATARQVENGGADFLLICTNTMHKMAPQVEENINIPLLHIADATAETIITQGYQTIGLLGTRFTMEQEFYKDRLSNKHRLNVLIPDEEKRKTIDDVIYNELVLGKIVSASQTQYITIIEELVESGAQGIILGCTEIGLLVTQNDCQVPLFNTTQIHAQAAVNYALSDKN